VFWQAVLLSAVALGIGWFARNSILNMQRQSIATGFGFLDREAGFAIGQSPIAFGPTDTYGRAFLVGLLNTGIVAVSGIILSTVLGTAIGIARLSSNWLLARMSLFYVEIVRNIPLLLQLLLLYSILNLGAPPPRQAWHPLPGIFLSNRGLYVPVPATGPANGPIALALLAGILAAVALDAWARRRQAATGRSFPVLSAGAGLVLGLPGLVWLIEGAPTALDVPALHGFNFSGGAALSPEMTALLGGLVLYTASYIAEIVRAGILAVGRGQVEAAEALGLRRAQILRSVVLPQALRIILPPLTSQYLNLTKNSTLAIAIGFPDLVFVADTAINQTGQAIEGMAIIMATYLTISIVISLLMNLYNARIALKQR
jgi:general L-amino acid transport system permease protein